MAKKLDEVRKTGDPAQLEGTVPTVIVSGAGAGAPGGSGEEDEGKGKKRSSDGKKTAKDIEVDTKVKDAKSAKEDGTGTAGKVPGCTKAGHPVDVQRGVVIDEQTDLSLPGLIPIDLIRYYNSDIDLAGLPFGRSGWLHSYHRTIELTSVVDDSYRVRSAGGGWIALNELTQGVVHFFRGGQLEVIRRDSRIEIYSLKTRQTEVFARLEESKDVYWLTEIQTPHGGRVQLSYLGTQLQTVQGTCGRTLAFTWDEGARLVRAGLCLGGQEYRAIHYQYNEVGELAAVKNALGFSDQFEYNGLHKMVKTTLKNGVSFYYRYDPETGKCIRTWGDNAIHSYEFSRDEEKREVVVTGTNEPLVYTFDENGESVSERSLDGSVDTKREYDPDQLLLSETNAAGETTTYEYDDRGHCTQVTDTAGAKTRWFFRHDLLVKRITPDGLETVFRHDGFRKDFFEDHHASWQRQGHADHSALADGPQFSYLGAHLNLSAIHFPTGDHVSLEYDQQGRLVALRDSRCLIEAYEYSEHHEVVRISDGRGASWQFSYDALGQAIKRVDSLGATSTVEYDAMGQAQRVRFPDGSESTSAYDALGSVSEYTDPLGRRTALLYGGTGVLTQQKAPDGSLWHFGYDTDERLRKIINPRAEVYEFAYNRAGLVEEELTFDGRRLHYTYDAALRLARISKPGGEFREFYYDSGSRLIAEHSNHGGQFFERDEWGRLIEATVEDGPESISVRLERDEFGRVIAEHQGDNELYYSYDAQSRRVSREVAGEKTEYEYDALGALKGITHLGSRLEIQRDILGREVRRIGNNGKLAVDSAYDLMGRLVSQAAIGSRLGGDQWIGDDGIPPQASEPKKANLLAQEEITAPEPAGMDGWRVLSQRQYQYDQAGRPTSIQDRTWGATFYKYDSLDQLKSSHRGQWSEVFEYDPTSSITSALRHLEDQRISAGEPDEETAKGAKPEKLESLGGTWHVDPGNILLRDDRFEYELDENHRRKIRTDLSTGTRTEYTWDCRDRLRQVQRPDGVRVRFFYDAFGRRVRKDVCPPLPTEEQVHDLVKEKLLPAEEEDNRRRREEIEAWGGESPDLGQGNGEGIAPLAQGGDSAVYPPDLPSSIEKAEKELSLYLDNTYEVKYLWDGDEVAGEVHSDSGQRVHVHRPGTFVPLLQSEGGEVFHVITDRLGTPKELIDGASRVAWSAAHGAWNNIQEQWFDDAAPRGRRVSSPFRGLGQYYDAETQLSCTRYRYWEAGTGRWLSADPLGISGGTNLLGFDGCPTIDVDPLGLACEVPRGGVQFKRWQRGQAIDKPLPDGSAPTWGTVKSRYWKNRYKASKRSGDFDPTQLAEMRKGNAPMDFNARTMKWESRELHHVNPQRSVVDNSPLNLRELTPDWHAEVDPFRHVPGVETTRGIR